MIMTDKNKKTLLIVIPIAVVVIAAIIVGAVLLLGGGDAYRTVKVYRTEGTSEVQRAGDTMKPYENMLLANDDTVKTLEDSYLYLKLDDDKFLMAEPSTCFKLIATGDSENSKTRIELAYGAVTIHVTNPLSDDSTFEVGTGNSTMAIRGTSFRVSTNGEQDAHTTVEVFEGEISVQSPADANGNAQGEPVSVAAGESAAISDGKVEKSEEGVQLPELSIEVLEFLKEGIENGNDVGVTPDELDEIIENKQKTFTVTFKYGDNVFATERVAYGQTAKRPTLMPAPHGDWDFDFSTEITEDITIYWIDTVEQ